jgi:hypothetical protein
MRRALVVLLLIGCGRIGYDDLAVTDAPVDALDLGVVEMSLRGNASTAGARTAAAAWSRAPWSMPSARACAPGFLCRSRSSSAWDR